MWIGGLILLGALIGALALPVRLEISMAKSSGWSGSAALRVFGRYGPRVPLRRKAKQRKKPTRKAQKGRGPSGRVVRAGLRAVRDLLGVLRIDTVRCDARVGLEDPADTGALYGALAPIRYVCRGSERVQLRVEPVFDGPTLTGRAELVVSAVPLRLVPPLLRFGWQAFGPVR